jgi:hypothetical protein
MNSYINFNSFIEQIGISMNNNSNTNSPIEKLKFPMNKNDLKNIKDTYDKLLIDEFISRSINDILFTIIQKAANKETSYEILSVIRNIFRNSPHICQLNYDKYIQNIIDGIIDKITDIKITMYPPGKITDRTAIHFDWS